MVLFVERFLLALCGGLALLLLANPMAFDNRQRISLGLAVVFFAYFLGITYTKEPTAPSLTLSDPVLHLEPENGLIWSTQPNQTVGVFTFSLHNTGLEDIDNITVTEEYFVAVKGDVILIKSLGGVPVENRMPPLLKSTEQAPVRVDFSGHIEIMNEVAANFKGPSLRGVKVTIKYRRRADGKDFTMVRGYAAVAGHAQAIYTEGSEYDSATLELRHKFLTLSEVTPHFNSRDHWTPVTKEIGQDADGRQTVRYY